MKLAPRFASLLGALLLSLPALAAVPTHSVWSQRPLSLVDPSLGGFSPTSGNMATVWNEKTRNGHLHITAQANPNLQYEFNLVSIGVSDGDSLNGLWDIYRNGTLVCAGCHGKAYGLSQPVGNYFKLYVGDNSCYREAWHYSGYITNRLDF